MGRTVMGAAVWSFPGTDDEARSSQAHPTTILPGDRVPHLVYDVSR